MAGKLGASVTSFFLGSSLFFFLGSAFSASLNWPIVQLNRDDLASARHEYLLFWSIVLTFSFLLAATLSYVLDGRLRSQRYAPELDALLKELNPVTISGQDSANIGSPARNQDSMQTLQVKSRRS